MDEKYWENLYNGFKSFDSSIQAGEDIISLQEFKEYVEEDPMAFYKNHETGILKTPGMVKSLLPLMEESKQEEEEEIELDLDLDLEDNQPEGTGAQGPTGATGPQGPTGISGATGATGAIGVNTDGSSYEGLDLDFSDPNLSPELEGTDGAQGVGGSLDAGDAGYVGDKSGKSMSKEEWDYYDGEEDLVNALNNDVRYNMDFEFEEDTNFEDVVQIYDKKQKKYHYVPLNTSYNRNEYPDKDYSTAFESFMKITQLGIGSDESAEENPSLLGTKSNIVYDKDGYIDVEKSTWDDTYVDADSGKELSKSPVSVIDSDGNIKTEEV